MALGQPFLLGRVERALHRPVHLVNFRVRHHLADAVDKIGCENRTQQIHVRAYYASTSTASAVRSPILALCSWALACGSSMSAS